MKEILYRCDRCDERIEGRIAKITPWMVKAGTDKPQEEQPESFADYAAMDFCQECMQKILTFMEG